MGSATVYGNSEVCGGVDNVKEGDGDIDGCRRWCQNDVGCTAYSMAPQALEQMSLYTYVRVHAFPIAQKQLLLCTHIFNYRREDVIAGNYHKSGKDRGVTTTSFGRGAKGRCIWKVCVLWNDEFGRGRDCDFPRNSDRELETTHNVESSFKCLDKCKAR